MKYLSVGFFILLIGIVPIDGQVGPWTSILSQDIPQLIIWLNGSNLSVILNTTPAIVQQILFGYQQKAYFGINYEILARVKLGNKDKVCHIKANRPDKGNVHVSSAKCFDCKTSYSSSSSTSSCSSRHKHKHKLKPKCKKPKSK